MAGIFQAASRRVKGMIPDGKFVVDEAVALTNTLRREGQSVRDAFEVQWKRNRQLDIGNHWTHEAPEGRTHATINMIREQINSMMAQITAQRPRVTLEPFENGPAQMYYIKPRPGAKLAARLMQENATRELQGEEPIGITGVFDPDIDPADNAGILGNDPVPAVFVRPLIDQGLLTDEDIIPATDATLADFLEGIVTGFWNEGDWDWTLYEQKRNCLVFGHRDIVVEWDEENSKPILTGVLEQDSWIDANPRATDIDTAQWYQFAQVMSIETAVARFPDHEEILRRHIQNPEAAITSSGEPLSDRYRDPDWERDYVVMYVTWIRDQKIKVNGKETVTGLREIRTVGPAKISDELSRYKDIPVIRYRNLTIPDSPYSIGQPELMEDLNMTANRMVSNFNDQVRTLSSPQEIYAQELDEQFKGKPMYSRPGRRIPVPGDTLERLGANAIQFIKPPPLDVTYMGFLGFTIDMLNDIGSRTDVSRGQSDPNAKSGVAIGRLQAAASMAVAQRSFLFEKSDTRLIKLLIFMIDEFMSVDEAVKYVSKYPLNVAKDLMKRASTAKFNVKVELVTSRGELRDAEMQKAILMRQLQVMDDRTLLEKLGTENPDKILTRIDEERIRNASLEQQVQASNTQQQLQQAAQVSQALPQGQG